MKRFLSRGPSRPFAALIFLLFQALLFGQSGNLISTISQTQAGLTSTETTMFNNLSNSPDFRSVKLIQLADIMQTQNQGVLNFLLPGFSDTIKTEATVVDYQASDKYSWGGKVVNNQGNVAFIKGQGVTFGHLQVDTSVYEIRPLSTTVSVLLELNSNSSPYTCATTDASPGTETPNCGDEAYNTCPGTITVLLLITQAGRDALNAIVAPQWQNLYLMFGGLYTNIAFYNSDIPNKAVRVIIEPEVFPFNHDMDNKFDNDLDLLAISGEDKRSQYQADVVFLITERDYKIGNGNVGGVVKEINAEYADAYAIVRTKYYNTPYVFSHELGHILGGRHNLESGDDTNDCHHAHTEYFGDTPGDDELTNVYKTITTIVGANPILGLLNVPHTTSLNYSNPTVFYGNGVFPTGTNEQNNALAIRNRLCYVNEYGQTEETQIAIVQGFGKCNRNFTAEITGLPAGPYSYQWRWNLTGNFTNDPYTVLGYNSTVDATSVVPCSYFLLLIVSTGNGVVLTRQRKLDFCTCMPGVSSGSGLLRPNNHGVQSTTFDVFPNPVPDGSITVSIPATASEHNGQLSLFNSNGSCLFFMELLTSKSAQRLEILTGELPTGLYSLRFLTEESSQLKKLIVINRQ